MMIRMKVERTSHTLEPGGARRMTGSAGKVLDVMVNAIVSNGRRVWGEGGEILPQVRPTVNLFKARRIYLFFFGFLLP